MQAQETSLLLEVVVVELVAVVREIEMVSRAGLVAVQQKTVGRVRRVLEQVGRVTQEI
tara:strand:+ start:221 stop:394 length:174 start_codon:yes stop_codon:yes gene_type:complete